MPTLHQIFSDKVSFEGKQANVDNILQAREERAALQKELLNKSSSTLLSVSLVSPGAVKINECYRSLFRILKQSLEKYFVQNPISLHESLFLEDAAGFFGLYAVELPAEKLKEDLIQLENQHYLGRFWDLDVFDAHGKLLNRNDWNKPSRRCLICQEEAKVCAREQRHSYEELGEFIQLRTLHYLVSEHLGSLAHQSLREEVLLSPKPGLVDQNNNGAHQDMDLSLFLQSAEVLHPFFIDFTLAGIEIKDQPATFLFQRLRNLGLKAEEMMFQRTQKVNTHKGAIFSFALFLGVIGALETESSSYTLSDVFQRVALLAKDLPQELLKSGQVSSKRREMYQEYELSGARGTAAAGFPILQEGVLPFYQQIKDKKREHQDLMVLLYLLAYNPDTNLVNRGGIEALEEVQAKAKAALKNEELYQKESSLITLLKEWDKEFIERNLSPGGSADLLALSFFLRELVKSI